MDETDIKILQLLKNDGRMPFSQIGQKVALSSPAVKERISKLEDQGIITGYTIKIDHAKLGQPVQAFVLFETNRCRAFREFCATQKIVLECSRLAGRYSYLVKVAAASMNELELFIDAALKYGSSSTQIVFSSFENPLYIA